MTSLATLLGNTCLPWRPCASHPARHSSQVLNPVITAWRPARGRQGPSSAHTRDRGEESGQNAFIRTYAGPHASPYGRWSSLTLSSLRRISNVVSSPVASLARHAHQVSIPSLHHRKISEAPLLDGSVRITHLRSVVGKIA